MLPGPVLPGCSLVSFHFLWAILCPQAVGVSNHTPWVIHSVMMFCSVFFLKSQLPLGLYNYCSISPTAGATCQKCFSKHHDWADAPECTTWSHFNRILFIQTESSIPQVGRKSKMNERAEGSLQCGVLRRGSAGQRAAEEQRVRAVLAAAAGIQRRCRGWSKELQEFPDLKHTGWSMWLWNGLCWHGFKSCVLVCGTYTGWNL